MDEEPPYWFTQYVRDAKDRDDLLFKKVDRNNERINKLEGRVNLLFAGLATILTLVNVIAPMVDTWIRIHG